MLILHFLSISFSSSMLLNSRKSLNKQCLLALILQLFHITLSGMGKEEDKLFNSDQVSQCYTRFKVIAINIRLLFQCERIERSKNCSKCTSYSIKLPTNKIQNV